MTENKRFTDVACSETGHIYITDNGVEREFTGTEFENFLNELNDKNKFLSAFRGFITMEHQKIKEENEQLKKEYLKLDNRHGLLHDECLDVECERDSLKKDVESLEKENEQLKQLIKKTLETTPIEHNLAVELKNSVRELYG